MVRRRQTPKRAAAAARLRGRALIRLTRERALRDTRLEIGEGLLLADSAVRMAVKNHILVATLQQGSLWDRAVHLAFAVQTLQRIADEQDGAARRMVEARDDAIGATSRPQHEHDYGEIDVDLLEKRRTVYRSVAAELRRRAADDAEVLAVVEEGRADAWFELGTAIEQRLGSAPPPDEGMTATVQELVRRRRERDDLRRTLAEELTTRTNDARP